MKTYPKDWSSSEGNLGRDTEVLSNPCTLVAPEDPFPAGRLVCRRGQANVTSVFTCTERHTEQTACLGLGDMIHIQAQCLCSPRNRYSLISTSTWGKQQDHVPFLSAFCCDHPGCQKEGVAEVKKQFLLFPLSSQRWGRNSGPFFFFLPYSGVKLEYWKKTGKYCFLLLSFTT